jgi:hypothetical protein
MGFVDRRVAVFVKSLRNALPLDVVTIITSRAAPDPVRKRLGVNARCKGCLIKNRTFPEAVEDSSHELRRKLWGGFRDPRRRFFLRGLATAAPTWFAANRCEWGCLCFRFLGLTRGLLAGRQRLSFRRGQRCRLVRRRVADVAATGQRRNDPAAHEQQMKDGYIKGVAGNRPAVISVNMLGASLAVNEFLARLHPFREEPNGGYGAVIFSLASMEIITEPEDGVCEILRRHVGAGDTTPLLGVMELAETRPA